MSNRGFVHRYVELDLVYDLDVVWNIWFKSWNWGLKNVQNYWARTLNGGYTKSKKLTGIGTTGSIKF